MRLGYTLYLGLLQDTSADCNTVSDKVNVDRTCNSAIRVAMTLPSPRDTDAIDKTNKTKTNVSDRRYICTSHTG